MKKRIFGVLVLLTVLFRAQAQDDFSLVKIDNSEFPTIEVYIRTEKGINPNEILVREKGTILKISADTIPAREIYKGRSILFIIQSSSSENVLNALSKVILSLNRSDEMNIGVVEETEESSEMYYLSPEFSNNQLFFSELLTPDNLKRIHEINKEEKCRNIKRIEKIMSENADSDKNRAMIFIDAMMHNAAHECSGILKNNHSPLYFLQINATSIPDQKEWIDLCTKSGGIFTTCKEEETEKYLQNYLEDIKYYKGDPKTNVYRIIFQTTQKLKKNYFSIHYNNTERLYVFNRPDKKLLTEREKIFLGISMGLLAFTLFVLLRKRRSRSFGDTKVKTGKMATGVFPNPIEINVRIKGLNKTYFFEKHIISIGRSSNNDIIIPDRTVSGNHAVINKEGNDYLIQDLGSTNGVVVNQKKVKKMKLQTKDKIKLGGAILVVRL